MGKGAYKSVKGNRYTAVLWNKIILVSWHFSSPSSKSGYAKTQPEVVVSIIEEYFRKWKQLFPDVRQIYVGSDLNFGKVADSNKFAGISAEMGLFVGNDTSKPNNIGLTEVRDPGRSNVVSLQRLKWDLVVNASKMLFITTDLSFKAKIQEGAEKGTPGPKVGQVDHAAVYGKVSL